MDARSTIVATMITELKKDVSFKLVKPYQGELDRYRKITQIKSEIFPAEVNLQSPFALVISKEREQIGLQGRGMKLKHNLSIYIGSANTHNFNDTSVPEIYSLLTKAVDKLRAINGLILVNEGLYLARTDLFYVYDQQWFIHETY